MPTVLKDIDGPDFPFGLIVVAAAGSPKQVTQLVDASNINDPSASNVSGSAYEYGSLRFNQLMFQGFKAAANGLQVNTGNVYVVRKDGDRDDYGTIVAVVKSGETVWLRAAPSVKNAFSPYRYWIDADNNGDSCLVTGFTF